MDVEIELFWTRQLIADEEAASERSIVGEMRASRPYNQNTLRHRSRCINQCPKGACPHPWLLAVRFLPVARVVEIVPATLKTVDASCGVLWINFSCRQGRGRPLRIYELPVWSNSEFWRRHVFQQCIWVNVHAVHRSYSTSLMQAHTVFTNQRQQCKIDFNSL